MDEIFIIGQKTSLNKSPPSLASFLSWCSWELLNDLVFFDQPKPFDISGKKVTYWTYSKFLYPLWQTSFVLCLSNDLSEPILDSSVNWNADKFPRKIPWALSWRITNVSHRIKFILQVVLFHFVLTWWSVHLRISHRHRPLEQFSFANLCAWNKIIHRSQLYSRISHGIVQWTWIDANHTVRLQTMIFLDSGPCFILAVWYELILLIFWAL